VGVVVTGSGSSVGGSAAGAGNVISGNTSHGVSLGGASNVVIQGNLIGLTADSSAALANGGDGIRLDTASSSNILGVAAIGTGVGNTISGNIGYGVNLVSGASDSDNLVAGNLLGLDGSNDLRPNGAGGIAVDGLNNTVGGTFAAARNVVSGNSQAGLTVGSPRWWWATTLARTSPVRPCPAARRPTECC